MIDENIYIKKQFTINAPNYQFRTKQNHAQSKQSTVNKIVFFWLQLKTKISSTKNIYQNTIFIHTTITVSLKRNAQMNPI